MGQNIEQSRGNGDLLSLMLPLSQEARRPDRYDSLPTFSREAAIDRRHENQHILAMHDLERRGREAAAEQAIAVIEEVAAMEAIARTSTEAKYRIQRAHLESQVIAGDDPVLRASFAVLDDQMVQTIRLRSLRWMP